jgi:hypothetical protein
MNSVRIPPPFIGSLTTLKDLPAAEADALIAALSTAEPTLKADALADSVLPGVATLDRDQAVELVRVLTSLTALRRINDWSIEQTAEGVARSEDLTTPEDQRSDFADRVARAMHTRSVRLLGKATDMAMEHDKVFIGSRILTDLRPIFGDELSGGPDGAVITHTLKIEFVHDEGSIGNTYIVLDSQDVKVLKAALDRAEQKADAMKSMLSKVDVSYLGPEA